MGRRELGSRRRLQTRAQVRVRVEADRQDRADVHAELKCRALVHDHLVRASRIGQPAADEGDAVHRRVRTVATAADRRRCLSGSQVHVERDERRDVRIYDREICDLLHVGQARDLRDRLRVVGHVARARSDDRAHHPEVVGVHAREEGRERRLCAPCPGHGSQRQPAHQRDQQHDREQAAPTAPERGPEPVPRDPEHAGHRATHPSDPELTASRTSGDTAARHPSPRVSPRRALRPRRPARARVSY